MERENKEVAMEKTDKVGKEVQIQAEKETERGRQNSFVMAGTMEMAHVLVYHQGNRAHRR